EEEGHDGQRHHEEGNHGEGRDEQRRDVEGRDGERHDGKVGVVDKQSLLVTLKTDPDPGTVDVVPLSNGAVSGTPVAVSAPAGTLTPFGFAVYPDGTAVVTLAHSNKDGLFRNGA